MVSGVLGEEREGVGGAEDGVVGEMDALFSLRAIAVSSMVHKS